MAESNLIFKVWSKTDRKFISNGVYMELHNIVEGFPFFSIPTVSDDIVIMRHTGYLDADIKPICEGYIMTQEYPANETDDAWTAYYEVKMHRGCWVLMEVNFDYSDTLINDMNFLHDMHDEVHYWGHIYDNPKLTT